MPGALLPLRVRRPAASAHQHGRADLHRRAAGHRHEPRPRQFSGGRARLFRLRSNAAVLPADRPRARPSRARPGAGHGGRAAGAAGGRRRRAAARRRHRSAGRRSRSRAGDLVLVGRASASASTAWSSAANRRSTPASSPARACRPQVGAGAQVFAGTLNLGAALTVRATRGRRRHAARRMRPPDRGGGGAPRPLCRSRRPGCPALRAGGTCAAPLLTFLGWYFGVGAPVRTGAAGRGAVLIITCPCALALAVPAVQVIATGRLFRAGILLKSPTALERLAEVDTVVFDKTGTLTEPLLGVAHRADAAALPRRPRSPQQADTRWHARWLPRPERGGSRSRHRIPGARSGLEAADGEIRLGSRTFAG